MPSIQDVVDQVNAKLDQVVLNTAQSVAVGGEIRDQVVQLGDRVAVLDAHVQAGLTDLAGGIFAVLEVERAQLGELRHHTAQNGTVICLLANTTDLLCGITRKMTAQLGVGRDIAASADRLAGIVERVWPAAAGDLDRLAELREQVERCCPPPEPEPEPCPEPCRVAEHRPYRPAGQDWKPAEPREPIG